jgi:LysM repeat protein
VEYCTIWQDIYRFNESVIGPDPGQIAPGMVLTVYDRCNTAGVYDRGPRTHAMGTVDGQFYTVAAGDTLYSISQRFGLNVRVIMVANDLTSTSTIYPGTLLYIPGYKENQPTTAVHITYPLDGFYYSSPYVVSGTAEGIVGETLIVRILDGSGDQMAQQQTVVPSGTGAWQVTFYGVYGPPNSNGTVEAFSPQTGATDSVWVWFSGY